MNPKFRVLILGSDANAYYMARCCYEAFGKKAHLIGKDRLAFTKFSNILTIEYQPLLWNEPDFLRIVNAYAKKYEQEAVLLISTNETYSLFLANNKKNLAKNLVYSEQNPHVLKTLTNKELFYKTYHNKGLSFPDTYYFDVTKNHLIPSMDYPIILKPANVVMYNHLSFEGKHKIYKIQSEEEVKEVISRIKQAGYTDRLILQEYIKGDDSYLFDSVVYVDKEHHVKVISFAQIGLQERSKSMVGNAATLINGFSTFPQAPIEDMKQQILSFMEGLDYTGFAEIDMKYDEKSNTFKVLEINARQGRCSYYLAGLGANLVQILVDDLIFHKNLPFLDLKEEVLLSFVPKKIVKTYVVNEEFKGKALRMWKKRLSPMECKLDKNFKRFLMMKKRLWHYKKEYQNAYWQA